MYQMFIYAINNARNYNRLHSSVLTLYFLEPYCCIPNYSSIKKKREKYFKICLYFKYTTALTYTIFLKKYCYISTHGYKKFFYQREIIIQSIQESHRYRHTVRLLSPTPTPFHAFPPKITFGIEGSAVGPSEAQYRCLHRVQHRRPGIPIQHPTRCPAHSQTVNKRCLFFF